MNSNDRCGQPVIDQRGARTCGYPDKKVKSRCVLHRILDDMDLTEEYLGLEPVSLELEEVK